MLTSIRRWTSLGASLIAPAIAAIALAHPSPAQALSLCGAKIHGSNWSYNSVFKGYTLHVEMTACGRATAALHPKPIFDEAVSDATRLPNGQHKGWDPSPGSLFEQFECHAFSGVAPLVKGTWNLDAWRPQVSWAQEVREKCNPAAVITDPIPAPAPAPAPLPTLPAPPEQPLEPLPTVPSAPPPAPTTYAETSGGVVHTWTNYTNAGGYEGPAMPGNDTVQIACKLGGFRVQDGNTWWYRIASSPWNYAYYGSADAFYNEPGRTSGSLLGTPFVDPDVPNC
jgi:hypothetical protein